MKLIDVMSDDLVSQAVIMWCGDKGRNYSPSLTVRIVAEGIGMLNYTRLKNVMDGLVDEGVLSHPKYTLWTGKVVVFTEEYVIGDLL